METPSASWKLPSNHTDPEAMASAQRAQARELTEQDAIELGTDAYVFGYPLIVMDVTREISTAVSKPEGTKAPLNQFAHVPAFPDDTFTDVASPNADTLYSLAWLDLGKEPLILSVPDTGERYYLIQMLDAWTNVFAAPGSRTTGNRAGNFAIVGPHWIGRLPEGVTEIKSPTDIVWIVGRTQTNGRNDYAAVHAIQSQYMLTPLSAWGKSYTPPANVPVDPDVDSKTPPVERIARMNATQFFGRLNTLMRAAPPAKADAPALARFEAIGIGPGKTFDTSGMDAAAGRGLEQSLRAGQERIKAEATKQLGTIVNGWSVMSEKLGKYGTDYLFRAVVAMVGVGANLPADAVYPHAMADSAGQPLSGANRYVTRFLKGELPPVNAFWSLTMYNDKQAFVKNPIDRYAIGDRDKLRADADGSVTIHIQKDSPGAEKESNWLPAPPGPFNVFMRLYWPKQEILDGTWKMPPVERVG
jgi:hypothetical protein